MEYEGYQYEGAEASFELLMKRALGKLPVFFELVGYRVIDEKRNEPELPMAEATIMVRVDGQNEHTAAHGHGPVNALDNALRKALDKFYPELKDMRLLDYKVRVLPKGNGTSSTVRVLVESGDDKDKWGTVGVSFDIVEASWTGPHRQCDLQAAQGTQRPLRYPAGRFPGKRCGERGRDVPPHLAHSRRAPRPSPREPRQ